MVLVNFESPDVNESPAPSHHRALFSMYVCWIWKLETCRHLPGVEQHVLVHRVIILM